MQGMLRAILAFGLLLVCLTDAPAQVTSAAADAALRAITMVDAKEGWAVGDDGLVLHTIDGWETCEKQTTHVRSSLRGIHFVDAYRGYVVGAEALPYGRGTAGVILGTTDGGTSWQKLIFKELPGLSAVRFLDADTGFAFGDTTGGNSGGVFMTSNGGKTWRAIPTLSQATPWNCGTLVGQQLIFAGPQGQLGTLERDQVIALAQQHAPSKYFRAMAAQGQDAWVVGSQAAVRVSRQSQGKLWESITLPMSGSLARCLDFQTVTCSGDHIWIAGRPGSIVFHSWDRGKSWEVQRTGQPLPLLGICFANEKNGWAVGELGAMLKTGDGGRTWSILRRGAHRSAVMTITATPQDLPVGTLAVLGGDQGYIANTLQMTHRPGAALTDQTRIGQAMRLVGGTTGEVSPLFPLADFQDMMPAEQLAQLWGQGNANAGTALLEEQLVLALRLWRPSIVLFRTSPNATAGLTPLLSAALRKACELASRADAYPEHFTKLDLQPWQPVRLYHNLPATNAAAVKINLDEPRPILFASANDYANLARPILFDRFVPGATTETHTLWENWGEKTDLQDDLLAGLSLRHGGQARRESTPVDDVKFSLLKQATSKQIADTFPFRLKMADPAERRQFFAHFEKSLTGLAPMTIGDRIVAQAQAFVEQGQWTMARECHLMLLDLLPTHRLAPESCRFILTTMGSSEIRRRVDLKTMSTFADYPLRSPDFKLPENGKLDLDKLLKSQQRTALQRRQRDLRQWQRGSLAAGEILSVLDPLAYHDPATQLCLQSNLRQEGSLERSHLRQTEMQLQYAAGPWHNAAAAEQWLAQPIGEAPKTALRANRLPAMPKIDGKLDEECWKSGSWRPLQTAAGAVSSPAEVMFAYDDQHLYLAVRCRQPAGLPQLPLIKPRRRDDDLRQHDRISLMLDLDRDYCTYFHFEFDQRGCVTEDCCGDRTWNPKWYVEVQPSAEGWTAEVAIPLVELTGVSNLADLAWGMNVTRIVPGQGLQAVSVPASVAPRPEGMGLLLFDPQPIHRAAK